MPRRRRASTPGRIAAAIVNARNRSASRIRSSHSASAPTTTATTTEAATNARRAVCCTAGLFPMLALQETLAWTRSRGRDRRPRREGLRRRRDLAAPGARRPARGRRGGRARADARGPAPRVRDGRRRPARPRPRPSAEAGLPPRRTPRRLSRGPPGHGECLTLAAARGSVSKADRKSPATARRAHPRRTLKRMARILRTTLPDGYFHVTANSVHETLLFRDDRDRLLFLWLFGAALTRFTLEWHVYCLLGMHYHAVLAGRIEDVSRAAQWYQSTYAREHNARTGRQGALFRERFSSWVIHDEDHYANTVAYILANPVRAGLVARPEDWPWSGTPSKAPRSRASAVRSDGRVANRDVSARQRHVAVDRVGRRTDPRECIRHEPQVGVTRRQCRQRADPVRRRSDNRAVVLDVEQKRIPDAEAGLRPGHREEAADRGPVPGHGHARDPAAERSADDVVAPLELAPDGAGLTVADAEQSNRVVERSAEGPAVRLPAAGAERARPERQLAVGGKRPVLVEARRCNRRHRQSGDHRAGERSEEAKPKHRRLLSRRDGGHRPCSRAPPFRADCSVIALVRNPSARCSDLRHNRCKRNGGVVRPVRGVSNPGEPPRARRRSRDRRQRWKAARAARQPARARKPRRLRGRIDRGPVGRRCDVQVGGQPPRPRLAAPEDDCKRPRRPRRRRLPDPC